MPRGPRTALRREKADIGEAQQRDCESARSFRSNDRLPSDDAEPKSIQDNSAREEPEDDALTLRVPNGSPILPYLLANSSRNLA